jgi:type I restriction enzyme M protein
MQMSYIHSRFDNACFKINFNRFFYKYVVPRRLHLIDAELKQVERDKTELLGGKATE